jgi:hypothetical protein
MSINPMDYGILIHKINMKDSIVYFLHGEKGITISINSYTDHNLVEFFKDGTSLIKFIDIFDKSKISWKRIIHNKNFYFENGEQILLTSEVKTKFIKKQFKKVKI